MKTKALFVIFSLNGFVATLFGAFGAHWVKHHLSNLYFSNYATAVNYHYFYTSILGILSLIIYHFKEKLFFYSYLWFALGVLLFSGSLYGLALSQMHLLAIITPFGGFCYIMGWITLFIGVMKIKDND